ncbi:uncharacterized protein [Miscanthus floridulus]|uniref:uncharacterized protein n=1 Tax=Miscanthus floridulus TaxID=154761 RepID=UPI0034593600
MDRNPLFDADVSADGSSHSSIDGDSAANDAPVLPTPPAVILQTVNIKSHVPIVLQLTEPNYVEWRTFFDSFIGKFGLSNHLSSLPTVAQRRDPAWLVLEQCILSWIYNSVAKEVLTIVRVPKPTAYIIWTAIEDQFRDNELHRAMYLEAEYRNLVQGDMDIAQYTGHLKQLNDALHDVGQPVGEMSQLLNLLHGLNSKYWHAVLMFHLSLSHHRPSSSEAWTLSPSGSTYYTSTRRHSF